MPLIDDRGRVFGKVSLIDALVGLLVLVLIPLAYGALRLFRVPAPKITSVEPAEVVEHSKVRLRLAGEDFRPFLRARVGGVDYAGFLVQSPTFAEVEMPDLPRGTYDLSLFNEGQELVRKPGAVTVVGPPPPSPGPRIEMQAVGAFVGLVDNDVASRLSVGSKSHLLKADSGAASRGDEPPVAEVLALRAPTPWVQRVRVGPKAFIPWRNPAGISRPAIIRLSCAVVVDEYCKFGETSVKPDVTITLPWPLPPSGKTSEDSVPNDVMFHIDVLRSVDARPAFP